MGRPGPQPLVVACNDYDRTRALHTGRIGVAGADLRMVSAAASEIFTRMTRDEEFDVAEMSLSMFLIGLSQGDNRFVGLPVFPLRALRHRDIYVAGESQLRPGDLAGQAVGLRHFHMTSAVWQRGLLADDYRVAVDQIRWVRAEADRPGRAAPRLRLYLPDSIELTTVTDRSLVQLLESGDITAALMAASGPARGHAVRRIFDDPRSVEHEYHRRTGIYPIMHLLVIRRDLLRAQPWLSIEVTAAFELAKQAAYEDALSAASPSMSPFDVLDLERDRSEFGDDLYPYGLAANLTTLEAFRRYCAQQSLAHEPPPVPSWFDPNAETEPRADHRAGHRWADD